MPGNISYTLTLTSEGLNSGPYYNVTYTTSSIFYPVTAGSPAYLPNVGSTAIVAIPSASYTNLAFNLNNGAGGDCEYCNNDLILVVTGSDVIGCCAPTITSIDPPPLAASASFVTISFSTSASPFCTTCSFVTLTTSSNGVDWGNSITASCTASQFIVPSPGTGSGISPTYGYYRLQMTCSGSTTSSFSATSSYFPLINYCLFDITASYAGNSAYTFQYIAANLTPGPTVIRARGNITFTSGSSYTQMVNYNATGALAMGGGTGSVYLGVNLTSSIDINGVYIGRNICRVPSGGTDPVVLNGVANLYINEVLRATLNYNGPQSVSPCNSEGGFTGLVTITPMTINPGDAFRMVWKDNYQ
jgi:hypothetical protein